MMINSTVAIIIVNWKKYDITSSCIESILNSTNSNFKIILVDNESDNKKVKNFKFRNEIEIIQNKKNEGFSKANNIGIDYALKNNYDYTILINNDTIVEKNLIEVLLKTAQAKNLSVVQPLILNYNGKEIWNAGGRINYFFGNFITRKKLGNSLNSSHELTEWFTGCCCLFKTKIFKDIGKLDERFFAYYEDVDFSLRLKKYGYKIGFTSKTQIYHHESFSSISNNSKGGKLSPYVHYLNIRNHILILKKHSDLFNSFGTKVYQIFKIMSYSIYFIFRLRFTKLNMVYKGLLDSYKIKI
jgi:GT2 family glycosyltransferase